MISFTQRSVISKLNARLGLKAKMVIGASFLVMIPLVVMGYISCIKSTGAMEQVAVTQSLRIADGLAQSVERFLKEQRLISQAMATSYSSFGGMDIRFYGGKGIDELTAKRVNESLLKNIEALDNWIISLSQMTRLPDLPR